MRSRITALFVLIVVLAAAPAPAVADGGATAAAKKAKKRGWAKLRGQGGFSIRAPRGYRLTASGGGYEVAGRAGRMTLLAVSTAGATRTVAEALLGPGLPPTPNADHFGLKLGLKDGDKGEIYFSRAPTGVAVVLLDPPRRKGKPKAKGKSAAKRPLATSSAQIGNLQRRLFARIAGSARNLGSVALPASTTQEQEPPLALKPFTTVDGSAKAMVPDAPGWVAGGSKGIVEGYNPEQGSYAFGVALPISEPWTCFLPPCAGILLPSMPVQDALRQAWPLVFNQAGGNVGNVQIFSEVPNSGGLLGPGFLSSGMFQLSFQANGRSGLAYAIAGTTIIEPGLWLFYYSYIAAYNGVPGTIGDALLRTWQSWDPSVNQAERQAQTIVSQQETTRIIQSTGEYQRRVYEKTNYNWDAYIRGNDPVLDPVVPNAVGEGGQTLVQGSDGKFFNFAGSQFKKPGE